MHLRCICSLGKLKHQRGMPDGVCAGQAAAGRPVGVSAAAVVGAGGADSLRKGPQRMQPLAPFAKQVGCACAEGSSHAAT